MRISSLAALLLLLLLLGACHRAPADTTAATTPGDNRDRIDCANGTAPMAHVCTVDRLASDHGLVLTIRHPDGAFRRLLVTGDGRGVVAADGARRAVVTIVSPDLIDVSIDGDRYRLPATVKATPTA